MGILSIPNTIEAGQPVKAAPVQENFEAVRAWGNGGISTVNLADAAVTAPKLANNAVTREKVAAEAITMEKLSKGVAFYTLGPRSVQTLNVTTPGAYVDIPDTTIAAFSTPVDALLIMSGSVEATTAVGTTPAIYLALYNGNSLYRVWQQTVTYPSANARYTIPLTGPGELTALTTYNMKLRVSMSVAGAVDIRLAWFSALIVPR